MRALFGLILPLIVQVFAYVVVFAASQGGGSFMGLVALPVAPISLITLLGVGVAGVRQGWPLGRLMATSLSIAIVPPVLLLIFRALES
jgi:hypothetical protein